VAELVLRLRVDPVTGRRELVIDYASDSDAIPLEHEDEHRRLAAAVVEGGLASGRIAVARGPDPAAADPTAAAAAASAADPIAAAAAPRGGPERG
jgi:hypothetical protein